MTFSNFKIGKESSITVSSEILYFNQGYPDSPGRTPEILGPDSGHRTGRLRDRVRTKAKNKPKWTIGLRKGENMAHKTIEMCMSSAQTNIIS